MANILVIDDDPFVRRMLRLILEVAGHQVREAGDGVEGLRLFHDQPSDLLFCDLFMPNKDGVETIRELRRESRKVKVVAMSGGAYGGQLDLLDVAADLGADHLLSKPFGFRSVLGAVRQTLGELDPY